MKYDSINDAHQVLINALRYLRFGSMDTSRNSAVVEWMYRNDATPEQAAMHFSVA